MIIRGPSLLIALVAWWLPAAPAGAEIFAGHRINRLDDAWLAQPTNRAVLDRLLEYQTPAGGWCSGYDARLPRDRAAGPDGYGEWGGTPSIDNGATHCEVRILSRAFNRMGVPAYRDAALRGLDFLLDRQYANGGWPQCSPKDLKDARVYNRHITFNDNAMVNVMTLMRDVAAGRLAEFAYVDPARRQRALAAFDRGLDCILRCQIRVQGQLTGWCQQHDARTLAPAGGRSYELPSIAGAESSFLFRLLAEIENPSERVQAAIEGAAAWFFRSRIVGKRLAVTDGPIPPGGNGKTLIDDEAAPPLWARFYDIESNRPFFCSRDGVKRWSIGEIEPERARNYMWFGSWGDTVERLYEQWLVHQYLDPADDAAP